MSVDLRRRRLAKPPKRSGAGKVLRPLLLVPRLLAMPALRVAPRLIDPSRLHLPLPLPRQAGGWLVWGLGCVAGRWRGQSWCQVGDMAGSECCAGAAHRCFIGPQHITWADLLPALLTLLPTQPNRPLDHPPFHLPQTLPVPVTPAVDPARHAICISSLTDMGFGWRDAEAAADAAGGELETALHLLTAGAVGSRSGGGWADDSAPGTLGLDSYSDWHAPADASQAGSWDWGASCGSLKAHASDWGQQYAAAPSVPAAATQEADATWQHYVPPPEDRGVADDAELDELMAMLGLAC